LSGPFSTSRLVRWPASSRDAEGLAHVAVFMSDVATLVRPRRRLAVVNDEPDKRVVECALIGNAKAIVTDDHQLLDLRDLRGVRLLSLRDYLVFGEA